MPKRLSSKYKRVVIKVGSSVLSTPEGHFSLATLNRLVKEAVPFQKNGGELIWVSSGAIASGMDTLKLAARPKSLPDLQACAAVGQSKLMKAYEEAFSPHGVHTGQVLLTRDGFYDRLRYLNIRNTLNALLHRGVVPIINENDTISTDEICFGDNDMLAALLSTVVQPDLVVIFTDVDGLLHRETGERIVEVESIRALDEAILSHVKDTKNERTVGGMQAKLAAVRVAMQAGITVVLTSGKKAGAFEAAVLGEEHIGTFFIPTKERMSARKQWLAHNAPIRGKLLIDEGASRAVIQGGKSLLAGGIQGVEGSFKPGDIVSVSDLKGDELARGLVNYASEELSKIMGKKSTDIRAILKTDFLPEVIHRDNLAVLTEEEK